MPEPERSREKTRVEVTFEPSPGDTSKTRITLVHNGFPRGPDGMKRSRTFATRAGSGSFDALRTTANGEICRPGPASSEEPRPSTKQPYSPSTEA